MIDIQSLTIDDIKKGLIAKDFTAVEVVTSYLDRIKKLDSQVKAFITVTGSQALAAAQRIDRSITAGKPLGKLVGSVMAVKDIYLTQDIQTTSSSQVLNGYLPQYSATVYQRLIDQDAIVIGKTNTDTFAFGASTENSGYFTTHNPWNFDMVPGGSSGGSAASQAASFCTFALGTDTGGSIRQPASLCGVTGLKTTYGRNSRYGITAMASSFDTPGFFGQSTADIATILAVTAGQDPHDATTSPNPVPDYSRLLDSYSFKKLRVGLPTSYLTKGIDPEVKQKIVETADFFQKNGAEIIDVTLPDTDVGIAVYYILVPCEISSNMARYDGIRFGQSNKDSLDLLEYYMTTRGKFMEPEIKRRVLIGTYALSSGYFDAYYTKASKVRTLFKNQFQQAFQKVDVILSPVSPTTAWPIGQKANDPLAMYLADIYTCLVNVAGLPSLALPCGFDTKGLPIGFQLIGNYFAEDKLLSIGHQYQQLTDYHLQKPKL